MPGNISEKLKIPEQIKSLRIKLNMSQSRFGLRIGVSGKSISAYETGRCQPTLKVLKKISSVYKVPCMKIHEEDSGVLNDTIHNIENCLDKLKDILKDGLSF